MANANSSRNGSDAHADAPSSGPITTQTPNAVHDPAVEPHLSAATADATTVTTFPVGDTVQGIDQAESLASTPDQTMKDRARGAAYQAQTFASEKTEAAKSYLGDRLSAARKQLDEATQSAGDSDAAQKATAAYDDAKTYIRTKPTQSLLIAAGAGYLLGRLIKRG